MNKTSHNQLVKMAKKAGLSRKKRSFIEKKSIMPAPNYANAAELLFLTKREKTVFVVPVVRLYITIQNAVDITLQKKGRSYKFK